MSAGKQPGEDEESKILLLLTNPYISPLCLSLSLSLSLSLFLSLSLSLLDIKSLARRSANQSICF
jgi:hypothetical protein